MDGREKSLDIQNILYTKSGKPKASIFSIAHLNDNERMFFVSILLNQSTLMGKSPDRNYKSKSNLANGRDFGYFPPVANPPSKLPLLTLLKQARAFGLGVLLATQNPVDLDYKGLSNTGTWFIGRLQTENDKPRVLDGLEGASQTIGKSFNRQKIDKIISGLQNRTFLMSNAHEDGLEVLQTRWALSYLRGPLSRDQIKVLMEPQRQNLQVSEVRPSTPTMTTPLLANKTEDKTPSANIPPTNSNIPQPQGRPTLSPNISQFFISTPFGVADTNDKNKQSIYHPYILGGASINFVDKKSKVDLVKEEIFITPVTDGPVPVEWRQAKKIQIKLSELQKDPSQPLQFVQLPNAGAKASNYEGWRKDFIVWLSRNSKVDLLKDSLTQLVSLPEESEGDFRVRLDQKKRERRDEMVEKLRRKYAPKITVLQERIRRAQQSVEIQADTSKSTENADCFIYWNNALGAFMGRRTVG